MAKRNKKIGQLGEKITVDFLKNKNYILLDKNFTSRWGEVDLIFKKDNKIHFIEVKTRVGNKKGKPFEAINFYKIRSLRRCIDYYLLKKNLKDYKLSLDIVSIILDKNLNLVDFKYFENYPF